MINYKHVHFICVISQLVFSFIVVVGSGIVKQATRITSNNQLTASSTTSGELLL